MVDTQYTIENFGEFNCARKVKQSKAEKSIETETNGPKKIYRQIDAWKKPNVNQQPVFNGSEVRAIKKFWNQTAENVLSDLKLRNKEKKKHETVHNWLYLHTLYTD